MSHFALRLARAATILSLVLLGALPCRAVPKPESAAPTVLPAPTPRGPLAEMERDSCPVSASTTAEARARLASSPADPAAYLELAKLARQAGDPAIAAQTLEDGRRNATPCPALLVALGESYILLNRLADAEEATQAALQLDQTTPGAQLQLGRIYELIGWTESAVECYEKAVAQAPQDATGQCALVMGLIAAGRAAAAERQCRAYLEASAANADLWIGLGESLEAQQKLRDAFNAYGRALAANDQSAGAHARRGRLYCRFGQFDAATAACLAALACDPDCALAHAYLGIAYAYQGEEGAAREHALRAQQAGMRMDPVWDRLAQ